MHLGGDHSVRRSEIWLEMHRGGYVSSIFAEVVMFIKTSNHNGPQSTLYLGVGGAASWEQDEVKFVAEWATQWEV